VTLMRGHSAPDGGTSARAAAAGRRPRVLVLSRNYPNNLMELLGVWAERLVRHTAAFCEPVVVAPVPYVPPIPGLPSYYAQYRKIERRARRDGIDVHHPRFLAGPGYSLYDLEPAAYYAGVRGLVDRLHRRDPFELIHAVFTYPDGVVGTLLGKRLGLPVVITEQVPWGPWLDRQPRVRRQSVWAARRARAVLALSTSVQESIRRWAGPEPEVRVVPNGVDGDVFVPCEDPRDRDPDQILYAGRFDFVKGADVLLGAMRLLLERRPSSRLLVIGGSYYRRKRLEEERIRRMAVELGLDGRVRFTDPVPGPELARAMRRSAVLVLPSRAESFGTVLVEALSCGTPVVATRCGGPEDIVTESVGVLVPVEDERALADGMESVLVNRSRYDPSALRAYALERFSWRSVAERVAAVYDEIGLGTSSS